MPIYFSYEFCLVINLKLKVQETPNFGLVLNTVGVCDFSLSQRFRASLNALWHYICVSKRNLIGANKMHFMLNLFLLLNSIGSLDDLLIYPLSTSFLCALES